MKTNNSPAHWLLIVNPAAGNGRVKKRWPAVESSLRRADVSFTAWFTKKKGHAVQLLHKAVEAGFRRVVAVGGDGTANEVVNGIFTQQLIPSREIIFTVLPIGTGNDWIRSYRIPKKIRQWISYLRQAKAQGQDVGIVHYYHAGKASRRHFINVAGMAYDAFLVRALAQQKPLFSNKLVYYFSLLKGLWNYSFRKAKVRFDGQTIESHFYSINVGIGRYAGGGMQPTPHALPYDGYLALTLMRKFSKLNALFNTPRLFLGTIDQHPKVSLHKAKSIEVDSLDGHSTLLEVDGEFLGDTPVKFEILEKALSVWAPVS